MKVVVFFCALFGCCLLTISYPVEEVDIENDHEYLIGEQDFQEFPAETPQDHANLRLKRSPFGFGGE